ncbi:MAG: peptide chain release factor N(5)-glutamine methyltransferase [Acidobacteria bacterium]|nr:peptide chain release factor N(5)-glutamine methyltransferase [Acidobacteriota bacterium]
MTIEEAIKEAASKLRGAGVANERREASSLVALAISREASFLIAHPEYILSSGEKQEFLGLLTRRCHRVPFQHLTGLQEFYGLEFRVSPSVLIPRPETEILVEKAIDLLRGKENSVFLELGVGSGCISIAILSNVKTSKAVGVDLSPQALAVTAANADNHAVLDRMKLLESDLFEKITGQVDLIVSNPPYIPNGDIDSLQPEVRDFEPHLALAGGSDGLDIIRRIIDEGMAHLRPGGNLLVEIGYGQSSAVGELLGRAGWIDISFINDLQGIPRIAFAAKGS